MAASEEPLVLINAFEVPPHADDEFIRGWEAARDYLQTQPGYVDTALHRAISPDTDFRFVNVGRWQSPQHFQAAIQSAGFREASMGLAAFRPRPGLYEVVRNGRHLAGTSPRRRDTSLAIPEARRHG